MSKLIKIIDVIGMILFAGFLLFALSWMVICESYEMALIVTLFLYCAYAACMIGNIRGPWNGKDWSMLFGFGRNVFAFIGLIAISIKEEPEFIALPFVIAVVMFLISFLLKEQWKDFLCHPSLTTNWNETNTPDKLHNFLSANSFELVQNKYGKLVEKKGKPFLWDFGTKEYREVIYCWDNGFIVKK